MKPLHVYYVNLDLAFSALFQNCWIVQYIYSFNVLFYNHCKLSKLKLTMICAIYLFYGQSLGTD